MENRWTEHVLQIPAAKRKAIAERNKTYHERMISSGNIPVIIGSGVNPEPIKHITRSGSVYYENLEPVAHEIQEGALDDRPPVRTPYTWIDKCIMVFVSLAVAAFFLAWGHS